MVSTTQRERSDRCGVLGPTRRTASEGLIITSLPQPITAARPERLNAEGEARVLLAEGGASAQPPEYRHHQEKRMTRKPPPRKPIFAFFASWLGVTIPRVSLCSTPGYEPLAPLGHSTFQVVLRISG